MQYESIKNSLGHWLLRKVNHSGLRRVSDLSLALGSDIGLQRNENQDRVVVSRIDHTNGKCFIVGILCDGMGGMELGAVCASIAISTFLISCHKNAALPPKERIIKASLDSNDAVFREFSGTGGTTLSAFIFENDNLHGLNVGDSRVYSIYKSLEQLTIDDTLSGHFDAMHDEYSGRNDLLQFVGIGKEIEPHYFEFPKPEGYGFFMLTSDGVHFLPKEIISTIVKTANDPGLIVKRLLDVSKWCGGRDNASLIVFSKDSLPCIHNNLNQIVVWDSFGELHLFSSNEEIQDSESLNTNSTKPVKSPKPSSKKIEAKPSSPKVRRTKKSKQEVLDLDGELKDKNDLESPKLVVQFNNQ